MKYLLVACSLFFAVGEAASQAKVRRLPNSLNNPQINVFAPFMSLDGGTFLFTSDYADYGTLVYVSQREGGNWKQPVELPKHLNAKMHLQKSYTLSPDGRTLYMTSIKSGGVGGYDMWASDLKGSTWGELRNLYLPLNTKAHEGCPTFTPDEKTIYFMRCERMDMQKTDMCKIFVSRKNATGQWEEPVELPGNINTGNSQNPRIMADGETLIFASDKISPNKGGMDVYVTKFRNGTWSDPLPLDDVNTDKDDQYVSAQANGRYLIKEAPGKFRSEAVEYLIPDELRSKGVMRVDGTVKNETGAPTPAYVSVTNLYDNKRTFSGRPEADGSFYFYLLEGGAYELAVDHEDGTYTYYTKEYDLMENATLRNDKIEVVLKPLTAGDELSLDGLQFMPHSAELDNASTELRRLSRLLKSSPQFKFEVQVLLAGYVEDSIRSDPDLTEMIIDSTYITLEAIDTLGQMVTRDSLLVKTRFHNDRTEKQATAIIDQLTAQGVDRNSLTFFVNARPEEILDRRKLIIKILARAKKG